MKEVSIVDDKRRILLPKDVIKNYGKRFVIVKLPNEILLKPLPDNPLKALKEEGKKLRGASAESLRKDFEDTIKGRV